MGRGQQQQGYTLCARGISFRPALIEALLARGRWAAQQGEVHSARNDLLDEALAYAVEGGYRLYENDMHIGQISISAKSAL
ncbi:MAG: hypothetical protein JW953_01620 [Anaerolineae bacterium]|nr:hypothetical protein [Anaerolineae bacterium]